MQALLQSIQEECGPVVWRRARQMMRTGTVVGKRTHNDEIEVHISTKGGMRSPRVVLCPAHGDWSCECDSGEGACVHVAAAAIGVAKTLEQGQAIAGLEMPTGKVVHRLERVNGSLHLQRLIARGPKLTTLTTRLAAAKKDDVDRDITLSQGDIQVDLALGPVLTGKIPLPLMPRVLEALGGCTDVRLDGKKVNIGPPRPVICVLVEDHKDGFMLRAEQDPEISEIFDNGAVLQSGQLRAVGPLDLTARDVEELRAGRRYGFDQVADLVGRVLPALRERIPVREQSELLPTASPMKPRIRLQTEYDGESLRILPIMVYGDPPVARVDGERLHFLGGTLPLREPDLERMLATELREDLDLEVGKSQRFHGFDAVDMAERVRASSNLAIDGSGLETCFMAPPLRPAFDLATGADLRFLSMDGDQERFATGESVVRAWQRGESLVPLIDGGWAELPRDILARTGHVLADLVAAKGDRKNLPACALPDLARLCEAMDAPPPPTFSRLRTIAEDFSSIPPAELPSDLTATLRDYQRQGIDWLRFLCDADMGAMLADDMGLGKTLQALCVLRAPCLVVAPASVVHNWIREIERFRPGLSTCVYHGANREFDPDADVTLTTYAILRIDHDELAARRWDTVILDEAQNIKNPDSQVAQAAFELDARFRITLSGTPVENRLDELWSQFHFANQGLLGGRRDFQNRYARPISEGDGQALERMRQRIRPFLLRREKRIVAKELPPRTEVVLRCTLTDEERDIYDAIRASTQKEIVEQLSAGGGVMAALEALLRLRQACCHRGLLPGQDAATSSKLSLLMETVDKVIAEDHRALIFSQWTSLLDLTEPHLEAAGIEWVRLDGSTRDRGAVVDKFQDPDGPPVMLVSLKAGGTGLNLTAADNVFLLDPWWNPATEDQAADRAHRIGQERPVLVQRLVASDTVEERILLLQEKKRAIAAAATGVGTQAAGITRDDLLALLS